MANKRRLKGFSGFRFDLQHLRLVESSITGDFDDVLRGIMTGLRNPYVVRGFDVVGTSADTGANVRGIKLRVADSVVLSPQATEPGTIMTISPNEPDVTVDPTDARVIGDWVPGVNYVSIDYRRVTDDDTIDETAGWSASEDVELKKTVPIGYVLEFRVIISSVGFGTYLPLYTVEINNSEQITSIEIAQPRYYRLGSGGASPDPSHSFAWFTAGSPATRIEGPTKMSAATSTSLSTANKPWDRGDWAIKNAKDNDDAIKTRLKEITGSPLWYFSTGSSSPGPGSALNLAKLAWDTAQSTMTSAGSFILELQAETTLVVDAFSTSDAHFEDDVNNTDFTVRAIVTDLATSATATAKQSTGFSRTLTFSTHPFSAGQFIEVADLGSLFDGIFSIDSTTPTTVTYTAESSANISLTADTGTVRTIPGRGRVLFKNGQRIRIGGISGIFSDNDTVAFRLSQIGVDIIRYPTNGANDIAVVQVQDSSVYGPTGVVSTKTVTNKQSTTFTRSLTLSNVTGLSIGDVILVAIGDSNYNGGYAITNIAGNIVSYSRADTLAQGLTAAAGTIAYGEQFIATLSGASEPNFLASEQPFTILGPTFIGYEVANTGLVNESGTFTIDGLLGTSATFNNVGIGPLSWNEDIKIKGVIGNREYVIPYNAMALGVGTNTSSAATFGPGTVYFQENDQVAYLLLHRDLPVSASSYNISNGQISPAIIGNAYTGSDGSVQTIEEGDFIKIDTSPDNEWYRIDAASQMRDFDDNAAPVNGTGVLLLISKHNYPEVRVSRKQDVPASGDVYWLAIREDKNDLPTVYLRQLELELGEERQVNDNQSTNLLLYTGAMTESAIDPNYTISSPSSAWEFESVVTVTDTEPGQNVVYLSDAPLYGIQKGDVLVSGGLSYVVAYPLDLSTFVTVENISALATGSAVYRRPNKAIEDVDNLTKALRKVDRLLARFSTILERPVYDESLYIQRINWSSSAAAILPGYWITSNLGGLAWVAAVSNSITGPQEVLDPSTGAALSSDTALIHVIANPGGVAFGIGAVITQTVPGLTSVNRTVSTAPFSVQIYGASANGQFIYLPPNTRAGLGSNGDPTPTNGVVQPYAAYNAKGGSGGGELLLIANDTPRECGLDYLEDSTSSGPARFVAGIQQAARIQIARPLPVDTRLRFRNLATFGLPPLIANKATTLQIAYDGVSGPGTGSGNTINVASGLNKPVTISSPVPSEVVLIANGRVQIAAAAGSGIVPDADLGSQVGFQDARIGQAWFGQTQVSTTGTGQFPGGEWISRTFGIQSTGAALSPAFVLGLQDNRHYRLKVTAIARRTDVPGAYASFSVEVSAYRQGGGAVLLGSPITNIIGMNGPAAAYLATADVSGNNLRLIIAGDTGHTVSWVGTVEYQSVGTAV